ncbi:ROK family protein (plasmid) [Chloroflexota bacterium]|nr:ROK family protein [Chloroflexota bacterium]
MADLILGVEIGGTKLQLAMGKLSGEILVTHQGRVKKEQGGEGIRAWLKREIPTFIKEQKAKYGQVGAIGCGFGGPMDSKAGQVMRSIQIEGWQDFPIREWFEDTFELPTTVDNDSNAAAWGEYKCGFGRGCQHFFYTNIGSGVGGGFVFNGELFDGQGYGAGEMGQTYVADWTSKTPGAVERVENLCSGWAIESRLRTPGYIPEESSLYRKFNSDLTKVTARDLGEAAREGDRFAVAEIGNIARSFGLALSNVLCLSGVERIAIGGGVAKMGDVLIEPIRQAVHEFEFVSNVGNYEISPCELGDEIVLVGAILRAGERF